MAVRSQLKAGSMRKNRAVTALEYALIAAAIAAIISSAVFVLGSTLNQVFDHIWDIMRGQPHRWRG